MTKHSTIYPRLHLDVSAEECLEPTAGPGQHGRLTGAFERATSWQLRVEPGSSTNLPSTVRVVLGEPTPGAADTANPSAVRELADAISSILSELHQTRNELTRREAELAAALPVAPRHDEAEHLATRLRAILQGGAEAIGCHAAGLYLLDDATTELKLRSAWGLPDQRLLDPPRPLADAFADLEAIVGHAVAIEDSSLLPHWQVPESFPAAVCVPVSSPTDPLGTLWFFAAEARDFTGEQTNLAEIVAGRVAAELQREILLNECVAAKTADRRQLCATQWQHDHLPNVTPAMEDWQVAGWSEYGDELSAGFYDWFVSRDGSPAIALGVGEGTPVESALSAAALQATVRSHANYGRAVCEVIERVNETIWFGSAGGHFASLAYGVIREDEGEIEIVAAGDLQVLVVRELDSETVRVEPTHLGIEPELVLKPQRIRLSREDLLLVLPDGAGSIASPAGLEEMLRQNHEASAKELAALIHHQMPSIALGLVIRHR